MSVEIIFKILEDNAPAYLSVKEITDKCDLTRANVYRNLRSLVKRNEIQTTIRLIETKSQDNNHWVTTYRVYEEKK